LDKETRCPLADRLVRDRPVLVAGDQQHAHAAPLGPQTPKQAESVQLRHPNVEQRHVRRRRVDHAERLASVIRLADQVQRVVLTHQARHRPAHRRVVIGDQTRTRRVALPS
jgi:hypothetical protein